MAIFVALIFQVLFVFFAMSINVALVVQDKVNLQNAVDLAAYYGAQKQAELLNVMAHINYQIRQSWKLLAWRYRVLGGLGMINPVHPARMLGPFVDTPTPPSLSHPAVCVTHNTNWVTPNQHDNLCKMPNVHIPAFHIFPPIGTLSITTSVYTSTVALQAQLDELCDRQGAYNLWFSTLILKSFREDQKNRKEILYALARNLHQPDFKDLDGQSVQAGMRRTLLKNLTHGNEEKLSDIKFFNSLQDVGGREEWLSEVRMSPTILYADNRTGVSGCQAVNKFVEDLNGPERPNARHLLNTHLDPSGTLRAHARTTFPDTDLRAYSIGVEKNPWIWLYMGVRAEVKGRQLFFPFGSHVTLRARAFTKPFGGRIGPWYGHTWVPGERRSSSTPGNDNTRTDPLLPDRNLPGGALPPPASVSANYRRLPNHSRYPGDNLGLMSRLALAATRNLSAPHSTRMTYDSYRYVADPIDTGINDPMSWESTGLTPIRAHALAAISPDVFDITYYSIEPNFNHIYLGRLRANRSALGMSHIAARAIRGDLGSRDVNGLNITIQKQIEDTQVYQRPEAFYLLESKKHLLTAWLPDYSDYRFDKYAKGRVLGFAACLKDGDAFSKAPKVPGSCVAGGGRTGYSVKFISRDALLNGKFLIGGPGVSEGEIENKPDRSQGW